MVLVQEEEKAKVMNKQSRDKLQASGWKKGFFSSGTSKADKGRKPENVASNVDEVKEETNPQDSDEKPPRADDDLADDTLGDLNGNALDSVNSEQSAKSTETVESEGGTKRKVKKKVRFYIPEDEVPPPRYRRLISNNIPLIPLAPSWLKSESSTSSTSSDEFLDDVRGWKKGFLNLSFKKDGKGKDDNIFSIAEHHDLDGTLMRESSVESSQPHTHPDSPKPFTGVIKEKSIPGKLIPGNIKPKKKKFFSFFGKKSIFSHSKSLDNQEKTYQND